MPHGTAAQIIFVCTRGDDRDGIFPIGLIQSANQLSASKRGILLTELSGEALAQASLVVLHLHWDFNYIFFAELVRFIKACAPRSRTLIGGYIATVHPERLLRAHPGVDYVLTRDYEQPFVKLVEAVLAERTAKWIRENVPNVYSRAGAPRQPYRVTASELSTLDSHTIDWFSALEQYLKFQNSLNLLVRQ